LEPGAREKPDAELDTPLPKVSYAVLKDRQIRDLLAENDLSTAGDRSQLIARHERSV
jgi:E3 ubiquitin-protein ligase RAD18